jgi:hypothetical protein
MKLVRNAAALNRCTVTDKRWKRWAVSRWSPDMRLIRWPSSVKNDWPDSLTDPKVSNASGWKRNDYAMLAYLSTFLLAASSAALPRVRGVTDKYDSAVVWVTVTPHVNERPACHGMSIRPSGRLPSDMLRPTGSLVAGSLVVYYYYNNKHWNSLIRSLHSTTESYM